MHFSEESYLSKQGEEINLGAAANGEALENGP